MMRGSTKLLFYLANLAVLMMWIMLDESFSVSFKGIISIGIMLGNILVME